MVGLDRPTAMCIEAGTIKKAKSQWNQITILVFKKLISKYVSLINDKN